MRKRVGQVIYDTIRIVLHPVYCEPEVAYFFLIRVVSNPAYF